MARRAASCRHRYLRLCKASLSDHGPVSFESKHFRRSNGVNAVSLTSGERVPDGTLSKNHQQKSYLIGLACFTRPSIPASYYSFAQSESVPSVQQAIHVSSPRLAIPEFEFRDRIFCSGIGDLEVPEFRPVVLRRLAVEAIWKQSRKFPPGSNR